jgi:predicted ABC-type ATPase
MPEKYSDISIKYLDKIKKDTFVDQVYNQPVTFEEKIDGVKIHLIRNDVEFNPNNFADNWVVSFKGSILYPEEYDYSDENLEKIKKSSIGARQYAFIFDHLKKNHHNYSNIPRNTEFFFEFSMRKPTVVSEYSDLHNLFLISITNNVKTFDNNGNVIYKSKGNTIEDPREIFKFSKILATNQFPLLFEGRINSKENFLAGAKTEDLKRIVETADIDFSDPEQVRNFIVTELNTLPSQFSGMAEGFVIKQLDGSIVAKVSRPGQARGAAATELRGDKKDKTRMDKDAEQEYFNNIEAFCRKVFEKIDLTNGLKLALKQFNSIIRGLNKLPSNIKHTKLNDFQIKESIMLKGKLMLMKIFGAEGYKTKSLGLTVISGKPFHNGHYNLLEIAAKENDAVYAITSDTSRDDFSGEWSMKAFERFYLPLIRKTLPNVNLAFAQDKSPLISIERFLNDYSRNPKSLSFDITIYCHEKDYEAYSEFINKERVKQRKKLPSYKETFGDKIKVVGVKSREDDNIAGLKDLEKRVTTNISGTKMREILSDKNKELFMKFLPHPLSVKQKEEIWNLFTGTENMNEAILQIQDIIQQVINEGGNAPAINRDTGEVIANANETDLTIVDRSTMKNDMVKVFSVLNSLFEKKYKEPIWKDFSVITTGYAFNGSSEFFFSNKISDDEFKKHKPRVGDIDVTLPANKLKPLYHILSKIEGKKIAPNVVYVGQNKKSENVIIDQVNAIFAYTQGEHTTNVQVDFEGVEYNDDNKPDEFSKFGHNSDWEDIKQGFKGVAHKFLLASISRGVSINRNAIVVTPKSPVEGDKIKPKKEKGQLVNPRTISFSVSRGIRNRYQQMFRQDGSPAEYDGKHIYKEIPSTEATPEHYTRDLKGMFKLWFGKKPTATELKHMRSFVGILKLMKKYFTQDQISDSIQFLINDKLFGRAAQELVAPASMLPPGVSADEAFGSEVYQQAVQEAGHKDKNIKMAALIGAQKEFPFISSLVKSAESMAEDYYSNYGKVERNKIQQRLNEGGFRSEKTQSTAITPALIKETLNMYHILIDEFNKWMMSSSEAKTILDTLNKKSKKYTIEELQPIKALQPIGSGTHFEKDLEDSPDKTYGDIDILTSFPLTKEEALNDPYKLKVRQVYRQLFLSFMKLKKPNNVNVEETFDEQDVNRTGPYTYVIFDLPGDRAVQVDMVVTYHPFQEWSITRFAPERGIKGFTIGKMYSTLAKYIGISFESEGAVARLKGGKIHVGPKDKDTTFELVTLDFKNFLVDSLNYLAKIHGETPSYDPLLKKFTGVDPSNVNMVDFLKGIVGFAKSLEKSNLLRYAKNNQGNPFTSASEFIDEYKNQFKFYMDKKASAGKFDKAKTDIVKTQVSKAKKDADYAKALADKYLTLNESASSKEISIEDIKNLEKETGNPVMVLTSGGYGSGKSYVTSKKLPDFENIDMDAFKPKGDIHSKDAIKPALEAAKNKFHQVVSDGRNFVFQASSAKPGGIARKLGYAKDRGYTTVLLRVETSIENAIERNASRVKAGGHGPTDNAEYQIGRSTDQSKKAFETMKDADMVDYYVTYQN